MWLGESTDSPGTEEMYQHLVGDVCLFQTLWPIAKDYNKQIENKIKRITKKRIKWDLQLCSGIQFQNAQTQIKMFHSFHSHLYYS